MSRNKIETSTDEFHAGMKLLDETKSTTEIIKVPRELFRKLLFDHSTYTEVFKYGIKNNSDGDDLSADAA